MLPRWHIILGAIYSLVIYVLFKISVLYAVLCFLATFLIDFDHYWNSVLDTGRLSLLHAFDYHKKLGKIENSEIKKGIKRKGNFHLFHTIEFIIIVVVLGFLWAGFWFIALGMIFHSLIDIISLSYGGKMHRREFLLINYIKNKLK